MRQRRVTDPAQVYINVLMSIPAPSYCTYKASYLQMGSIIIDMNSMVRLYNSIGVRASAR